MGSAHLQLKRTKEKQMKKSISINDSAPLNARDFVYQYEPFIGESYQNCAYVIRIVRCGHSQSYSVYYLDKLLTGAETYLSAIEACARHNAKLSK